MTEHETLPCSGCHSPLPLEATGCQICMRSRTRQEIMRGYALLRERQARQRSRPFKILGAVLAVAASAALLNAYAGRLRSAAGAAARWADDFRNPASYASKKAEDVPAAPAAPAPPPVAPEAALSSQLLDPEPAREPAPSAASAAAAPAARPAAAGPPAKGDWRVSGSVYDLAELRPVAGAEITFLRDGREPAKAGTGDDGTFEIDLAKGDGWTVEVQAPGYRPGQVLELDPPYRARDADERRAALELITDGDLAPAAVGWKRASSRVRLDLIVVPSRWPDDRRR